MSKKVTDAIEELRKALMANKSVALEDLASRLLGLLVRVTFSRASSGSQRGGDGGVRGDGRRHLIYEAKRYDTGTNFNNRAIRGEIVEAVERNPDLEAWILVATRDVPEQTLTAMEETGQRLGIVTLAIDWMPTYLPRLATLCASAPDAVEAVYGEACGEFLAEIRSSAHYEEVFCSLTASVRDTAVGFELLRRASHTRIRDVWASRQMAESRFGQNVAGGEAGESHIERAGPMAGLDAWDLGALGSRDEPALVVGREGMGKTWAIVDWLQSRLDRLPIIVLAPSSALGAPITGRPALIAFIARCLRDLDRASERGEEFWEARVRRLLERPVEEGDILMLFFDGMNEKPSYSWQVLLDRLQDEPFHGRVRVVASARNSFVEERLRNFQDKAWNPTRIEVGPYDDALGGEFDRRLEAAELTRDDLPEALLGLARIPRLFDLVARLRGRLGGVKGVTVHRLLWEYGATAIGTRAFGPREWRSFVLQLAEGFLQGRKSQPLADVEQLGASAAISPDMVYQRASLILDGAFAQSDDLGDVEFEADFVRHALGLALIRELDRKNGSESKEVLERFLEPLNEHDEESEIIRAAVSIALAKGANGSSSFLGPLCERWVRCQNLPECHLRELAGLAGELIEPLLDVIEETGDHAASSPRYRAINALDTLDHSDASVAHAIAKRGERWLSWISQELGTDSANTDAERVRRRKELLESRIGTGEPGLVQVLGREVKIVGQAHESLGIAAVQLLQGRPLVEAIGFFEAAALHMAICREHRDEQGWLNLVNNVDPVETAECLRERSEAMLLRHPEDGVHEQLNKRVAAILLWRTGYQEDVKRALEISPELDRSPTYAEGYEKDPAESLRRLERRHAEGVLAREDVALRSRIQRISAFLMDPKLEAPTGFVDEVIRESHKLDWKNTATGKSRTAEDLIWRDLSRVLARFAPNELVRIERERLLGFSERTGEARIGAAMAAPDAMLLVGNVEREALCTLRERVPAEPLEMEGYAQRQILIAEVQGETAVNQVRRIASAGLEGVDDMLASACGSPSKAELEEIIGEYIHDPQSLQRIARVICQKSVKLGSKAFKAFTELLFGDSNGVDLDFLWVVLGQNSPERLGTILDERGWTWSGEKSHFENEMGSKAIAAANQQTPFNCFATRLSPTAILPIVSDRGALPEEVLLAVELLHEVIMQSATSVPYTALEISLDRSAAEETVNYFFNHGDIRETDEVDVVSRLFSRLGEDYQERKHSLAMKYFEDVMEARRKGANFHLAIVQPQHLKMIIDCCPNAIHEWLDGMAERSTAFKKRVLLADGFFVSLCEALLVEKQDLGVELWRALKDCLKQTKFTVYGDFDRLLVAMFTAESSAIVDQALEEVYDLDLASSDRKLIDLVVVARIHDRLGWLCDMVTRDAKSQCPLHQLRAEFLKPLLSVPVIADEDDWPQGEYDGGVSGASWKLGQREASARHWLLEFARAESEVKAYAAWQLFLACVDRRMWSWFWDVLDGSMNGENDFQTNKKRFVMQQKHEIRRAIGENERHWEENFAHRRYPSALDPWN